MSFWKRLFGSKNSQSRARVDGLYRAKTAQIPIDGRTLQLYTYIRFYSDHSVIVDTIAANEGSEPAAPDVVVKRFSKDTATYVGHYADKDTGIAVEATNERSRMVRLASVKDPGAVTLSAYCTAIANSENFAVTLKYLGLNEGYRPFTPEGEFTFVFHQVRSATL